MRCIKFMRVVLASAVLGVLAGIIAVIGSVVLSINGKENHISPGWLSIICMIGAIISLPFILRRTLMPGKRRSDLTESDS